MLEFCEKLFFLSNIIRIFVAIYGYCMKLTVSKSKNSTTYYIQKSIRTDSGKSTTKTVERLGSMEEMIARFGKEDPIARAREYMFSLSKAEKEQREVVNISFSPSLLIENNVQNSYNVGYLFLQKMYYDLGLDAICKKIDKRNRYEYSLNDILSKLIYTRILYPSSKRSSFDDAKKFIEQPGFELHDVYRALSVLAKESDMIQASVYKNSCKLVKRNTQVIYYDCTNYYFESEEENGLRQYGHSKEHRPNPIVQMGMFMDIDGFPLAYCINPGNTAETVTLKPLEDKLKENFGISRVVVCTDCGLSSYENRKNDHIGERSFITVQSLKRLKRHIQEWALDPSGWSMSGKRGIYRIDELNPSEYHDVLFYKERWINENGLEQRIIVTFSFKYQAYLHNLMSKQIDRANAIIARGKAGRKNRSQNDARRFIREECCTLDGELAQIMSYSLNQEMADQESRFDGFYAICTDLEDDNPLDIIEANSRRWIIENAFRIMKTDFEARPVYLQRDDRIEAHFLTCFLALLIYKHLEKGLNNSGFHYSPSKIISTLESMNVVGIKGEGYIPAFTRDSIVNCLQEMIGIQLSNQFILKKQMRETISKTHNSRSSQRKEKEQL